jgi:hypothetical protein
VVIDDFKPEICKSLQDYSEKIKVHAAHTHLSSPESQPAPHLHTHLGAGCHIPASSPPLCAEPEE